MIYTPLEYSKKFPCKGKKVSAKTITRKCEDGLLPSGHKAYRLTAGWIIEVPDEDVHKTETTTINRTYFGFK